MPKKVIVQMAISQYRGHMSKKGTFFSSTFKVEEKKVPLFFELVASGLRYGRFLIFFFGIFRHFLKLPLYKCLYFYLKIGKFLKRT